MKYCPKCKEQVKTYIKFDRQCMAYIKCAECDTCLTEKYDTDADDDYYEVGFMNDFGDSN